MENLMNVLVLTCRNYCNETEFSFADENLFAYIIEPSR